MPHCPKCLDEFQARVKVCPDCQVALVDNLSPIPIPMTAPKIERRNDPLVHIATAPNEGVAGMWKEILLEQGIRSLVKGADLKAASYSLPINLQCEILVLASDAEKAMEILEPFTNR